MTEFITTGKEASVSKYSAKQTQDGWQTEDLDWSWLGENLTAHQSFLVTIITSRFSIMPIRTSSE